MAEYNEYDNIGTEVEASEGLSKEDLAGAGLIGGAVIVGIMGYEGIKKGIHWVGAKLDEKGKNPITNRKAKNEEKQAKIREEAIKREQEKLEAELAAKAAESEEK